MRHGERMGKQTNGGTLTVDGTYTNRQTQINGRTCFLSIVDSNIYDRTKVVPLSWWSCRGNNVMLLLKA